MYCLTFFCRYILIEKLNRPSSRFRNIIYTQVKSNKYTFVTPNDLLQKINQLIEVFFFNCKIKTLKFVYFFNRRVTLGKPFFILLLRILLTVFRNTQAFILENYLYLVVEFYNLSTRLFFFMHFHLLLFPII